MKVDRRAGTGAGAAVGGVLVGLSLLLGGLGASSAAGRPAATATRTPTPTLTPTPDPRPGLCTVQGRQTADAAQIEIRRSVGLRLFFAAECPPELRGRADILLVFDRSSSMGDAGKLEAAHAAVREFVANVDFSRHRVGLVPFNSSAYVAQPLTNDPARILGALAASGGAEGSTNIAVAIESANRELSYSARSEAVQIIVLLTDGQSSLLPMIAAADRARERGVVIFSIGLGPDAAQLALSRVANSPDHYYYAPTPADLAQIYQRIATTIRNFAVTNIVLTNQLGAGVGYVSGSGLPVEPRGSASELTWWQPFVTPQGFALDFRVQVNRAGRVRPSEIAWADYTDGDGTRRRFVFDSPEVEVIVPDTHTIHLPLTFRQQCLPKAGWTDVALAVDNSASMAGSKLAQALAAAKVFLGLLQLPADQAAIVTYDQEARLLQPLTGDRRTLELVLDTITTGSGTRLDHGINLSRQELLGPRHRAGNRRAMVLLSDGRQAEAHPMVYEAADYARAAGITLFTIALGNDADRDLLRAVAGHESRAYFAPDVSALSQIYAQVAGAVSCR